MPDVMWMLVMNLPHTEVKFYPEKKSETGLISLRVSWKRALTILNLDNGEDRRGDGFSVYVKDCFKYKIREEIEHIWIEITYRNKNSSVLMGVFYQDSFNNTSKTE